MIHRAAQRPKRQLRRRLCCRKKIQAKNVVGQKQVSRFPRQIRDGRRPARPRSARIQCAIKLETERRTRSRLRHRLQLEAERPRRAAPFSRALQQQCRVKAPPVLCRERRLEILRSSSAIETNSNTRRLRREFPLRLQQPHEAHPRFTPRQDLSRRVSNRKFRDQPQYRPRLLQRA